MPPFLRMNWKALSMRPPLQPASYVLSQSTNSCSDSEISSPVTILFIPSTAAMVENAQQLPAPVDKVIATLLGISNVPELFLIFFCKLHCST